MTGGSAHEQAPASSGTNPAAAATFINLISLLLGSVSDAGQEADAGSEDASAAAEPKKEAPQANSNSDSNGILISLSPPPNCAPAAPTAGATKGAAKAESIAKRGQSEPDRKRRDPDQNAAHNLLPMNVIQGAAPAPMPVSRPEPTGNSSTPAVAQTVNVVSGSRAIPLAHAGFASVPAPASNKNEPPIAFILQLKPTETTNAAQSAVVQKTPAAATELLPSVAAGVNTNGKAASADTAGQKAAPEIKSDSTPAVNKTGLESDNHHEESTGQDRTKQSPDHERQPQHETQVTAANDSGRMDAPLKAADIASVGTNQPHSQTESFQDAPRGAESIDRPASPIGSTEQPKTGPVREISFQSSSPDSGTVKVQVIDRGGDVRISVRSADPNLTHALQRDVGQLVTKLDHSGYEAKAWNPREATSLAGIAESRDVQIRPETSSNSNSGSDSGSRGGQGGAHDQSQQQRRHGDARQWTNTLDDSVRRTITEDEEEIWEA